MIALLLTRLALAGALDDSSWRLTDVEPQVRDRYQLQLFESRAACRDAFLDDGLPSDEPTLDACTPWVDARERQLHLAFRVLAEGVRRPMGITRDRVELYLGGREGPLQLREEVELVPHGDAGYGQLTILLVDQSSSMYERVQPRPRMEDVVSALLSEAVLDTFFPTRAGSRSGVMLLTFNSRVRDHRGRPWEEAEILETREAYELAVDRLLDQPPGGYTHLYDAVATVVSDLMAAHARVPDFLRLTQADPALIVITDGFNDESDRSDRPDRCADNAPRLSETLTLIEDVRGQRWRTSVQVHTIGIGPPIAPGFAPRPGQLTRVTAEDLCGPNASRPIDGDLERDGIDNPSLEYLARVGGGRSYVGSDPGGVAGFLGSTGTVLHDWFELRVALPEDQAKRFRQAMPLVLEVKRPYPLQLEATLVPHPWFDGPGTRASGTAVRRPPDVLAATGVLLVGLGVTAFVFLVWVGLGNAWRAVAHRGRLARGGRS